MKQMTVVQRFSRDCMIRKCHRPDLVERIENNCSENRGKKKKNIFHHLAILHRPNAKSKQTILFFEQHILHHSNLQYTCAQDSIDDPFHPVESQLLDRLDPATKNKISVS